MSSEPNMTVSGNGHLTCSGLGSNFTVTAPSVPETQWYTTYGPVGTILDDFHSSAHNYKLTGFGIVLDFIGLKYAGTGHVNTAMPRNHLTESDANDILSTFLTAETEPKWLVLKNDSDKITSITHPDDWVVNPSLGNPTPHTLESGPYLWLSENNFFTRPSSGFPSSIDTSSLPQVSLEDIQSVYTGIPTGNTATVSAEDPQPLIALLTEAEILAKPASDWHDWS